LLKASAVQVGVP